MITDSKVLEHLNACGKRNDSILISNINSVLNRTRHLDDVPKPLKLVSVKKSEVCGVAKEFKILYNTYYNGDDKDVSTIEMNGTSKMCDYEVYVTMKSLVMLGINKNEERAIACRDLFLSILQASSDYITLGDMFTKALNPTGDYYYDTICDAIISEVYNEEDKIKFTLLRLTNGYVGQKEFVQDILSSNDLQSLEQLTKLLEEKCAKAKKDEEYKGRTRGVPKQLIGIDYMYNAWSDFNSGK